MKWKKLGLYTARMIFPFKLNLYLICVLTDFTAFVVQFTVARGLAEGHAKPWYLGLAGAGFSFSAAAGSLLGGWLAHRFNGRLVLLAGAISINLSIVGCALGDLHSPRFMPGYWLLGLALGLLYPPLIGWLNQGEDAHSNQRGVSRTLILFCVAWNLGMMAGQLTAGSLFSYGVNWIYATAFGVSLVNIVFAVIAVRRVVHLAVVAHGTPAPPQRIKLATAFKRLSWIANLGGMFGGAMVIHLLSDLIVLIGVPAENHGRLLAMWRGVVIATYLLMHHTVFWHYRLRISLASQALAAIGLLVIALADSVEMLLVGLALQGQLVGYNYFSSLYYSTAGSGHEERAWAAGIHEATLAAGMAIGTVTGGIIGSLINHRVPYVLAGVMILLLMFGQVAAWRRWVACSPSGARVS